MYKKIFCLLLIFAIFLSLNSCKSNKEDNSIIDNSKIITENNNSVQSDSEKEKIDTSAVLRGVDLSSLEAVEDYGGKFYDFDGKEKDPMIIFKENGVSFVRLRIFNNPTMSFDGGDYCNLEHTLKMAKRVKNNGLDLYLDFHYSDLWADPEKQYIPSDWINLTDEELIKAVYDYTYNVLMELNKIGAYPSIVQIGNEIGNGILWNVGTVDNFPMLVKLLNSGIKAVRDTQPQDTHTKVMIHLQDGCNKNLYKWFFDSCISSGLEDFDIIGLSYYSYFHGTINELEENLKSLKSYNKEIMIAETAFPYTDDDMDNYTNSASSYNTSATGYPVSVEGQEKIIRDIIELAAKTGCLGVCYWEPAWLGVKGAGWQKGEGNSWENQCLFDFEGNVLNSIKAFKIDE